MRRGPGRGPSDRRSSRSSQLTDLPARAKAGFVLLVGLSGGMMALQGDASVVLIVLMTLGGAVAGGALLWYMLWILG